MNGAVLAILIFYGKTTVGLSIERLAVRPLCVIKSMRKTRHLSQQDCRHQYRDEKHPGAITYHRSPLAIRCVAISLKPYISMALANATRGATVSGGAHGCDECSGKRRR
jgi:hypothetical protein